MFNHHGKNLSKEDILYEQASVGVSILEIEKKGDDWTVVLDSKYNRRIDANTKMQVSGAAKKEVLKMKNLFMELLQIVQMDKHLGELISPVKKILTIFLEVQTKI